MNGKIVKKRRFLGQCEACMPIEQQRMISLLGIRFWDLVQDLQVGDDDLAVTAWPENGSRKPVRAFRTPSDNYAFHDLPGLHRFEYPRPIDPGQVQCGERFIIKATDGRGRFLPVLFAVEIPAPKGVFLDRKLELDSAGPPALISPPGFLFSAPTRPVPPGIAIIRAQLKEYSTGYDAAYAVMEVEIKGKQWCGISDNRGSIAILFPYPEQESQSPPHSTIIPLYSQKWKATIRVAVAKNTRLMRR